MIPINMNEDWNEESKLGAIEEASSGTPREAARAMAYLRDIHDSTYHWCIDHDDLVICKNDKEYAICRCYPFHEDPENLLQPD